MTAKDWHGSKQSISTLFVKLKKISDCRKTSKTSLWAKTALNGTLSQIFLRKLCLMFVFALFSRPNENRTSLAILP